MKKLLIALAILASVQVANAQGSKAVSAAKAKVEAAKAASENAKKSGKMATWLSLGQAYMAAYNAPTGNILPGSSRQELSFMMGNEKPSSSDQVVVGGVTYLKDSYSNKDLYFNDAQVLQMVIVTKPVYEDALAQAAAAYVKAYELDVKNAKTKDIAAALTDIGNKYTEEAYNCYTFGENAKAAEKFMASYNVQLNKPLQVVDTISLHAAGVMYIATEQYDKAKDVFEKCIAVGFEGEDGDVYSRLALIADKAGDKTLSKDYLEAGFKKYPQSQGILIGLINYYLAAGEGTDRLFELFAQAEAVDPNNASLYYSEGNAHYKLGDSEAALKAYDKAIEVDPKGYLGYYFKGAMYYDQAQDLAVKAAEADYNSYKQFEELCIASYKNCVEPLEAAYNNAPAEDTKLEIARIIKSACFILRDQSEDYMAKYTKYNDLLK